MKLRLFLLIFVLAMGLHSLCLPANAQSGAPRQQLSGADPQIQPQDGKQHEVQQLIEALYISRLQEELKLSDEQYAAVIPAVKNYLRVRQMGAKRRHELQQEMNTMLDQGGPEEQIQTKLKEIDQVKRENEQALETARAAIDAKLDVRQRAQFQRYQQRTDQHIARMVQQIREGRKMERKMNGPRGMRQGPPPPREGRREMHPAPNPRKR